MYVHKKMSRKQIAQALGCGATTILKHMKLFSIPRRTTSECLKGVLKSESHRRKISESKTGNKHPNFGKKAKHHGKRCWYTCPDGNNVSMRSQWEVWYAEYLRENGITFQYEPQTFILSSGKAYTPDFYLPEKNEYVEVKGWLTVENRERLETFKREYFPVTLANHQYLKMLGIDLRRKWISTRPKFKCEQCEEVFFRIDRKQRFCSIVCRNRFLAAQESQISLPKENRIKRRYNGNQNGEFNNSRKLNVEQVINIRKMHADGKKIKQIIEETGSTYGNIFNIVHRRSWKDV